MRDSIYRITLDVHTVASQTQVSAKHHDRNRSMVITLMENGEPYKLVEGCKAKLVIKRPDDFIAVNDCSIMTEESKILYDFSVFSTSVIGIYDCELRLTDSEDELLTSPRFTILVEETLFDGEGQKNWHGDLAGRDLPSQHPISAIDGLDEQLDMFMLKHNPVGDGSFSMNRKEESTVGEQSVSIGLNNVASGRGAIAEGIETTSSGEGSHSEGYLTTADGNYSHAEGYFASAYGEYSHAEGNSSIASGQAGHAEGKDTRTTFAYSHAEGNDTHAYGEGSHSEGRGDRSYSVEYVVPSEISQWGMNPNSVPPTLTYYLNPSGNKYKKFKGRANGKYSHVEGFNGYAHEPYAHAEGEENEAFGRASHAEGRSSQAGGTSSHAEGDDTLVYGTSLAGHSEGISTYVYGDAGHAEGKATYAHGAYSHAEGFKTFATGDNSHSSGRYTIADGFNSFAAGEGTRAYGDNSFVIGKYNKTPSPSNKYAFIIGNGIYNQGEPMARRNNAMGVDWEGNADIAGDVIAKAFGTVAEKASLLKTFGVVSALIASGVKLGYEDGRMYMEVEEV